MQSYKSLFDQRGSAYDTAMRRYPDARREEFAQVIKAANLQPGMHVGDVPAGGSYLRAHLPEKCTWHGHEPCASFTNHGTRAGPQSRPLLPLPWPDSALDVVISLAGVHHLENKSALFSDIYRTTTPNGRFVLSDVQAGSNVALFLDGYIGKHNSTGHEGIYLDASTHNELASSGWVVETTSLESFNWIFDTPFDMAVFCHTLFDLRGDNVDATHDAIVSNLGLAVRDDTKIGMKWSLLTLVSRKDT